MNCPNCGNDNLPEARFCGNCGTALASRVDTVTCPACRQDNPGGVLFCNYCGTTMLTGCPNCQLRFDGDGLFCQWCQQFLNGPVGVKAASITRRVVAYLLEALLLLLTLVIGYVIWLGFSLSHGQTPGKQVLGIRVIRCDGSPSDWGWTFIREVVIKFGIIGLAIDSVTLGLGSVLDGLWAFWDRDRQALHDKIVKTVVVDDRQFRSRVKNAPDAT